MPNSAVLSFTDPDALYAAVRNAQVVGVVTARGNFRAELIRIDLNRVWMLRGEESLARIHSGSASGVFFVAIILSVVLIPFFAFREMSRVDRQERVAFPDF